MSQTVILTDIPVDEGFLRRECPYCYREFKILLDEDERKRLISRFITSFWLEPSEDTTDEPIDEMNGELTCPYCGQKANKDSWWTQEQLAYARVFAENMVVDIVDNLVGDVRRTFRRSSNSFVSFNITTRGMGKKVPWISPEINDMTVIDLPCCSRKMKIEDGMSGMVHCFFCGFPYHIG